MSNHNIRFLREIRKMSIFGKVNLGLTSEVNFDHFLIRGQVIKFDNSTTLQKRTINESLATIILINFSYCHNLLMCSGRMSLCNVYMR